MSQPDRRASKPAGVYGFSPPRRAQVEDHGPRSVLNMLARSGLSPQRKVRLRGAVSSWFVARVGSRVMGHMWGRGGIAYTLVSRPLYLDLRFT